ncbi:MULTISPECIES: PAS domain S-box protein [Pseudanabaena]|uniref:PAS domain S-box protein n=1 Tax=Pseudanabaena TaxID=1152 RepID=UPI00247AF80F|nr:MULTISPECIES: PAS domain S-box protein [Pseudanabaena]MEA5488214.1 PAS domain S-box protein [Pseudanabaena sp. CCNP1317]WGS74520.1 PAS domain S-box protein [Pseudanabaena galeata CCNP1313]
MQKPEIPANESDRLVALDRYKILDTLPEQVYDDLTQLAADICGTPIALISLVDKDRQWFKSRVGLDATETPRDISFCGHAVAAHATLNVPDASQDPRFADNPLVAKDPNIRFYAGVPLITHDNYALGTLCAIDSQPHNLTEAQIRQLEALSRLVINQLELRLNSNFTESQLDEVLSLKQAILDNANFSIIATDLEGTIQDFNVAAERMLGYAASEIVGKTSPAIFHELHEIASQANHLSQELNTEIPVGFEVFTAKTKLGQVYEQEWTYIRKDGSKFPVMLTITAIRTESGEITGYMGIAKDITEEKQSAKRVKDISAALDQTAIVAITDIQGTITFINDKFCEISKYRREELIGQNHRLLNSGHHPRSFFVEMWKAIASGQTWRAEIKNRAKDGTFYWVDTTIVPFLHEDGKPYQYLAIRKDITARKAADIELQKLSLIASKTDNVAIVTNAQGEIEWVNHSFHKLTGYTLAEVIGKKPGGFLQGAKTSQETVASIREALAKHEPFSGEILNYSKDGRAYWLSLNINPVFDDDGNLLQFIAIENEITTRKEIELKLRKEVEGAMKKLNVMNERLEVSNRELLDFAYVSSHDLQEPLRKIQAFGDRLKSTCQDSLNDKGLDYLERMLNAASRAQILINDLLDFSRVTTKAQPFQPINLSEVLEGVLSDLEVRIEKSGVILEVDPLPSVEADALQMRQILQNLIGNALKFLRAEVTPVVQVRSRVYMENEQEWCEIRVIDNGIGFEQQYAERIFQIFQRLHGRKTFEGTGIGLAICRKIAERHNGTLIAQGEPDQGATFIFTLPTHQPKGDLQDAD